MKKPVFLWRGIAGMLRFTPLVWLVIPSASATDLLVSNTNDSGPGSLRQAIQDAGPGDTIRFATNVTGTITLTTGELLVSKNLIISGPGSHLLTVSGNNASRIFNVTNDPVSISGLTLANGRSVTASLDGGGAVRNSGALTLTDCVLSGNTAARANPGDSVQGGAVINYGTLTVNGCTLKDNSSQYGAGAVQNAVGTLTVLNSTFQNNSCPLNLSASGGAIDTYGGAARISGSCFVSNSAPFGGAIHSRYTLLITNCTFVGNLARDQGGAIACDNTGTGVVSLHACTIASNWVSSATSFYGAGGGGIWRYGSGTAIIGDTIVAANSVANLTNGPDVLGTFNSAGYNLIGQTNGATGFAEPGSQDQVGSLAAPLEAKLGPLRANGGPTLTMLPLPDSPAVDRGNTSGPATDQRGFFRPVDQGLAPNAPGGDGSDIGAVELQAEEFPSAIPPSLVSWWRAEDNFLDSAGTNHGAPDSVFLFGNGQVGRAFRQFLLGGGYVRVPASPTLNVGAGSGFSVEAWINVLDTATEYPIVEWNSGPSIGAHLWANVAYAGVGTPGCIYASVDNNLAHRVATAAVLQAQTWHHVVMTYDRYSSLSVYVDGTLKAQTNFGAVIPATAFDLNIGRRPGGPYFYGMLDEVSLYNRALSAADVAALYVQGGAGKELPKLRIVPAPAGSVSLYWQLAYANYGLESRSNLVTAPWVPVAQPRTQAGAEWKTVAPLLSGQEFFRLRKP